MRRPQLIFALSASLLATQVVAADNFYDSLIHRARAGEHAPALTWLRQQPVLSPTQQLDKLLISSWAGLDEEVLTLYQRYETTLSRSQPAREAVARSLRNLQRWDKALQHYESMLRQSPQRADLRQQWIMTLADALRLPEALAESEQWVKQSPKQFEARYTRAYALMRAGEHYAALREFDLAMQLAPQHEWARLEYLRGLQRAGLSASVVAHTNAMARLSEADQRSMIADTLSDRVMIADTAARRESERFVVADRALHQSELLIKGWEGVPEAAAERQRVRIDRLGALHARVYMHQLRSEAEQLMAEGVALPDYARRWYAGALLYLREPEQAADIYADLISKSNERDQFWLADHQGLFYALVEAERLDEALALAEQLQAQQPMYNVVPGSAQTLPNATWIEARTLYANALLFNDRLPAAQAAFEELSDRAPENTNFRVSRAMVYQNRGWPREAEGELKIAETSTPLSLSVLAAQANNALELREWERFEELTAYLEQHYPESLQTQRLQKLRQVRHMRELRVEGGTGRNRGGNAVGKNDLSIEARLYSQPLAQAWRVFGGTGYARGSYEEGDASHNWQIAGVEWSRRDHRLEASVSRHSYGHGVRAGLHLAGEHDLDDHWQIGWEAAKRSMETPLRALNSDVDANLQRLYVQWRGNEQRDWRLTATTMQFSDDNDRSMLALDGRERLFTRARLNLDLGLGLAASRNSRPESGPYFSPKSDFTAMSTLTLNHVIHRRYENVWRQFVQVGVGSYNQSGYSAGGMGMISYGQRVERDDRLDAGFSLSLGSRPYDGERERELRLYFDISYRF